MQTAWRRGVLTKWVIWTWSLVPRAPTHIVHFVGDACFDVWGSMQVMPYVMHFSLGEVFFLRQKYPCRWLVMWITSRWRDYSSGDIHGLKVHQLASRTMLVSRSLLNPSSRTMCAKLCGCVSKKGQNHQPLIKFRLDTLLVTCDENNIKTTRLLFRWHTWAQSTPVGLSNHASVKVAAKILDVHHVCKVRVGRDLLPHILKRGGVQASCWDPVNDLWRE